MNTFNLLLRSSQINHKSVLLKENIVCGEWVFRGRNFALSLNQKINRALCDDEIESKKNQVDKNSLVAELSAYISKVLEEFHQVRFSKQSWNALILPWLYDYVAQIYCHYSAALDLIERFPADKYVFQGRILSNDDLPPLNLQDFHYQQSKEEFLATLFINVLELLGKKVEFQSPSLPYIRDTPKKSLRDRVRDLRHFLSRIYLYSLNLSKRRQALFIETEFPYKFIYRLLKNKNFISFPFVSTSQNIEAEQSKIVDMRTRNLCFPENSLQNSPDQLLQILKIMLKFSVPKILIEDFVNCLDKAKNIFPSVGIDVFTSKAYYYNEFFKLWYAANIDKVNLYIIQHGGHGLTEIDELNEIKHSIGAINIPVGDCNIDHDGHPVMPAPKYVDYSFFHANTRNYFQYDSNLNIVFILDSDIVNYLSNSYGKPYGLLSKKKFVSIIENVKRLINKDNKNIYYFKPYHTDYGRDSYLLTKYLDSINLGIYLDNKRYHEIKHHNQLSIMTYIPNAMVADIYNMNVPVVLFLDKSFIEQLTNCFKQIIPVLYENNLLFDDINELERFILNLSAEKLESWWSSKSCLEARNLYLQKIAKSSNNNFENWQSFIY